MLLCLNPFKVVGNVVKAVSSVFGLGGKQQPLSLPPAPLAPVTPAPVQRLIIPPTPKAPVNNIVNETAQELSTPASRRNIRNSLTIGTARLRRDLTSNSGSQGTGLNIPL